MPLGAARGSDAELVVFFSGLRGGRILELCDLCASLAVFLIGDSTEFLGETCHNYPVADDNLVFSVRWRKIAIVDEARARVDGDLD